MQTTHFERDPICRNRKLRGIFIVAVNTISTNLNPEKWGCLLSASAVFSEEGSTIEQSRGEKLKYFEVVCGIEESMGSQKLSIETFSVLIYRNQIDDRYQQFNKIEMIHKRHITLVNSISFFTT